MCEIKSRPAGRIFANNPDYKRSLNSHPEQEIKIPPPTPRSRSFTRFTMRVGLPHLGQSVLFDVSMTFLRSPVLAIFAIVSSPFSARSDYAKFAPQFLW